MESDGKTERNKYVELEERESKLSDPNTRACHEIELINSWSLLELGPKHWSGHKAKGD